MPGASPPPRPRETRTHLIRRAEVRVPTSRFGEDLRFFTEVLGFRLDRIRPADRPAVAALSGHGAALRLERDAPSPPVTLHLVVDAPERLADGSRRLVSPGGHRVVVEAADPPLVIPRASREFVVHRLLGDDSFAAGRAGMLYRDLLPDRLGGAMIASHIRIPEGGPVDDQVHFHTIGFQLIFCHRGWVRVVYEDQGPPFILGAGDCVIQPPEIRHRVLESSDGLEVIEIGVPAEHLTSMDHEMELPTPHFRPERKFAGTTFVHHREAEAAWRPGRFAGFEVRDTGIGEATGGMAGVQVARPLPGAAIPPTRHDGEILFGFVRRGAVTLAVEGERAQRVSAGDAYALPPRRTVLVEDASDDLEILEVALPAALGASSVPGEQRRP